MSENLVKDGAGVSVQAFPLASGKVNITTGTVPNISLIHCVVPGDIQINWKYSAAETIACAEGDDFTIIEATSVTVLAGGTFHLA